jgi:hypothetical protein
MKTHVTAQLETAHIIVKVANIGWESEIGEIIFRNEFAKYLKEYERHQSKHQLIFAFIFLQIYVESFLHHNMRRIIRHEYGIRAPKAIDDWKKSEKRKLHTKLKSFAEYFFTQNDRPDIQAMIIDPYQKIANIRHKFVHGHSISQRSDDQGNVEESEAMEALNFDNLSQAIETANQIGHAWNALLDQLSPKCRALCNVDSFKFQPL